MSRSPKENSMALLIFIAVLAIILLIGAPIALSSAASATSNLALAGTVAAAQMNITCLSLTVVALLALGAFAAARMYVAGKRSAQAESELDISRMQSQLDRARARQPKQIQPIALMALPAPAATQDLAANTQSPRHVRRRVRTRRSTSKMARWFR